MSSVTLKLNSAKAVNKLIDDIKSSGTNLELSSMSVGEITPNSGSIFDNMNQLIMIGERDEIEEKLQSFLGQDWKQYIV